MLFTKTTFIGIDPTAGQRPFAYVALDSDLRLLAVGAGDIEEVLAFVGGQQQAYVAVNAPRQPNQGLMAEETVRAQFTPPPRPGRWTGFRVSEYELRRRNISTPRTPATEANCKKWLQMGFIVYRRLFAQGYQTYPSDDSPRQMLEVYPHGAYTALLGCIPFPKKTLEGRLQRQLLLYTHDLDVPNPMRIFEEITRYRLLQGILPLEELHTPPELDALVAAYTAWMAAKDPDQVTLVGDPREGQITLPTGDLKARY